MNEHAGTILVVGATGAQGGSVARHLLNDGWTVRALTRDPRSPSARLLAGLGAWMYPGDLGDAAALRAAVKGIHAIFVVTDHWSLGAEREYRYGRDAVDAALSAGARHVVYSSLPEAQHRSGGTLHLPHHDTKARLEAELRAEKAPVTFVHPATYYENWPARRLERLPDGTLGFRFPYGDAPLAAVAIEDLGGVVAAVLRGGDAFHGDRVGVVGEIAAPAHYAAVLTRALGVQVSYRDVPRQEYLRMPGPRRRELADMFEFSRLYQADRHADLHRTRQLFPAVRTFEQWVAANLGAFAAVLESSATR